MEHQIRELRGNMHGMAWGILIVFILQIGSCWGLTLIFQELVK